MRGAAAPRTPRLKRKDTLHAYRVAANATDLLLLTSGGVRGAAAARPLSTRCTSLY